MPRRRVNQPGFRVHDVVQLGDQLLSERGVTIMRRISPGVLRSGTSAQASSPATG
jgi:hypothetical protein